MSIDEFVRLGAALGEPSWAARAGTALAREPLMILAIGTARSVPMPKFYIHFQNSDGTLAKDDVGQDLPGLQEAKAAALISAREIVADNVKGSAGNPMVAVIISNESGQDLMTIPAKDVLPEPLKG